MNQKTPLFTLAIGILAILGVIIVARNQFPTNTISSSATINGTNIPQDPLETAESFGMLDGIVDRVESDTIYFKNKDTTALLTAETEIIRVDPVGEDIDNLELQEVALERASLATDVFINVTCEEGNVNECVAESILVESSISDDLEELSSPPENVDEGQVVTP